MDVSTQQLRKGLALAVMANIIWGVSALYWIETHPVSPADVVAHRAIWSLPVAALVLILAGRLSATWALLKQLKTLLWSLLGTVLLSLNWGVFVYAVSTGRATEASLGYFMLPLLTIIVGRVVFQEVLGLAQRIAVALALCAVLMQIVSLGACPGSLWSYRAASHSTGRCVKKSRQIRCRGCLSKPCVWHRSRLHGCGRPVEPGWVNRYQGGRVPAHGWHLHCCAATNLCCRVRLLPLNIVG